MRAMEDFEWATKPNRMYLEVLGLWPAERKNVWKRWASHLRALACSGCLLFVCCIPAFHALAKIWRDLIAVIDNLQFTMPLLLVLIKVVLIWYKQPALLPLLNMVRHDWASTTDVAERSVMIRKAETARKIAMFGQAIMFVSLILVVGLPFLGIRCRKLMNETDRGKPMILSTYYVYDVTKSPQFELTYFAQVISLAVATVSYTGIDSFLGLLIFHVCGQFEILRAHVVNMTQFNDFNNVVRANVSNHIRLIRSVRVFESTFTLLLLLMLINFSIIFCFYGFLIITFINNDSTISAFRAAFQIVLLANAFGHACLYCIAGELVVIKSEAIFYAVYESEWQNLEPRKARNLILIMARAKSPLYITGGKIFPMTMATFCTLLKMTCGYISFLLTKAREI